MDKVPIVATIAASLLGVAYFNYLKIEPYPPDIVRVTPFIWLTVAVLGVCGGARRMTGQPASPVRWLVVIAALLNVLVAAIFCLAATMGD